MGLDFAMRPGISRPLSVITLSALTLSLLILSGCQTAGQVDKGPGSALAQRLTADAHSAKLSKAALRRAVAAERIALDARAPGTSATWKVGKDFSGEVLPGQTFEVAGKACRRFEHVIVVSRNSQTSSATACREENGDWVPLS